MSEEIFDPEFILMDRLQKIRQVIEEYGEENFYLSYSGGKDSTVLHVLLDKARIEQFIVDHLDPEKYTIQDVVELFILYAEFDFRRMTLVQL